MNFHGTLFVMGLYCLTLVLHVLVPAWEVEGYCCDSAGRPLKYRLNGILVWMMVLLLFFLLPTAVQVALHTNYLEALVAANALGVFVSVYFFKKGGTEKYARCMTVDQIGKSGSLKPATTIPSTAYRFYLGQVWNPRILGVDVKMWLYLVGAIMLQLNLLSCAVVEMNTSQDGQLSRAMGLYLACFSYFLVDYLLGERVHLYTYDLFAEKLGFKLAWGCLVFYPFYYPVGMFAIRDKVRSRDISRTECWAIAFVFLIGWIMTRGANMQKFIFRTQPSRKTFFCGLIKQQVIPGTLILCSGWWGLARHLNYFGEILQAVALALPGCIVANSMVLKLLSLSYPLYYALLFYTRQLDDDKMCSSKYGKKWDEYVKKVPCRIIPGVY